MSIKLAPLPDDENQRLDVVKRYDFGDPHFRLIADSAVEIACITSGAKIARLSIVQQDDIRIVAAHGEKKELVGRGRFIDAFMPLYHEPLIIHDLQKSTFWEPDISPPPFHTYIGYPLKVDRRIVGALAICDPGALEFNSSQLRSLGLLAAQIESHLQTQGKLTKALIKNLEYKNGEHRYKFFSNSTCIAEYDAEGKILMANQNFENLFRYTKNRLLGMQHSALVPFKMRHSSEYFDIWEQLWTGDSVLTETEHITADKQCICLRSTYFPVKNDQGDLTKIVHFAHDITFERQQARVLSSKNSLFKNLFLTAEFAHNGNIVEVNQNFADALGYTRSELKALSLLDITSMDCGIYSVQEANPGLNESDGRLTVYQFLTKTGSIRSLLGVTCSHLDPERNSLHKLLYAFDYSDSYCEHRKYRDIVAALSKTSAVVEFDADQRLVAANEEFLRLFEYNSEDILGNSHRIFCSVDEALSDEYGIFWSTLLTGQTIEGEFERYNKFGELLSVRGFYCPVSDESGRVVRVVLIISDNTRERKEINRLKEIESDLRYRNCSLQDEHSRYEALGQVMPVGIFTTDAAGSFNTVNNYICELTNYSAAELCTYGMTELVHPEDKSSVKQAWNRAITEVESFKSVHRILSKDNKVSWVRISASPVFDKEFLSGFIGIIEHRTDYKINDERLKLATEAAKIGIFDWNILSGSLVWNDTQYEIYGLDRNQIAEISYDDWRLCLVAADLDRVDIELRSALYGNQNFHSRFRIYTPQGIMKFVDARAVVFRDHLDQPVRMIGTNIDVTQQAFRESEMRIMRKAAEAAAKAKSDFLANMSHEMRTPLTSILGYTEAAQAPDTNESERLSMLELIKANGEHLLEIINDVLDISKINAGALAIEVLPFSPVGLLERLKTMILPKVSKKQLSFEINYIWELPATVNNDKLRVLQVLINLVNNAVKFTDKGGITVDVSADAKAERLNFTVTDTGIGMEPGTMEKLYKPFVQADVSTTREFGGTGLGLTICKELVDKMGGRMSVDSTFGSGSTFSFYVSTGDLSKTEWIDAVPATIDNDEHPPSKKTTQPTLSGKILLADDALEIRNLVNYNLKDFDLELTMVENGQLAVDKVMQEDFDLIMLDMQMPVLDGYSTAAEMRCRGVKVPIIAFTANAMNQHTRKSLESGCTTVLTKPFSKSDLLACIIEHISSVSTEKNKPEILVSDEYDEDPGMIDLAFDFVELLGYRLQLLKGLHEREEKDEISKLLHTMKGSASLYGYPALDELLEQLSGANKVDDGVLFLTCLKKLSSLFESIVRGLVVMEQNSPDS